MLRLQIRLSKSCKLKIMKNVKKLGVWMDHKIAHLMEFTNEPFEVTTIESKFPYHENYLNEPKSDVVLNIKQQHKQFKYYKKIGEVIKDYYQVILFGPSDAKLELFNILSEDNRFMKIKVEIKETDRMTRSQLHLFVNEYFSAS